MKQEDEPVEPGETVLRLIWSDFLKPGLDMPVQPGAFEPRKNETDGISVFRAACLADASLTLEVIAEEKRGKYAIASLLVSELSMLGLTVVPARIEKVPGHAVLVELNIVNCKADKPRCRALQKQLAEIASRSIVRLPAS